MPEPSIFPTFISTHNQPFDANGVDKQMDCIMVQAMKFMEDYEIWQGIGPTFRSRQANKGAPAVYQSPLFFIYLS